MAVALIELVGARDTLVISGDLDEIDESGIALAPKPTGAFGTAFTARTIPLSIGGRDGGVEVPVTQLIFTLNIHDAGEGIDAGVSRVRKLFGSMFDRHKVLWRYTPDGGNGQPRWLVVKLEREIQFTPEQDWEEDEMAVGVVTATALEPRYESAPQVVDAENPSAGTNTVWLPCWNPTDQPAWPEWSLMPETGPCQFAWADYSFGQEQDIDLTWTPGEYDDRMIGTPVPIGVNWSVMSDRAQDTYLAADLSNADGVMGGVQPLFPIPPYTGTPKDPIMLPVTFTGPAGAKVQLILRRLWSAESGLD